MNKNDVIAVISLILGILCSLNDGLIRREDNPFLLPEDFRPMHCDISLLPISDEKNVTTKDNPFRLPGDVRPAHYNISLLPILDDKNFTTLGHVDIILDCIQDTTQIKLNSVNINIDKSSIQVVAMENGRELVVTNFIDEQKSSSETITIQVQGRPGLLAGNQYTLSISFVSILNDELRGLYRSPYLDENGVTKYIAMTQMAAPDARRAFPCFDEPAMKATFSLRVGRKSSAMYHTLSNMPRLRTLSNLKLPGYVWDEYEPTPKMPTYLVALVVSDFVNVPSNPELSPGIEFNIWTRPGYENQTLYAGNIGPRLLSHYSKDYLGINYPISKLDMVAVPDFVAGAMENWGLIIYREASLLIDERSPEWAKKRVASAIAHEIAHQWLGNLVTHEWWNVVWLKEGFARYMEYIGADIVEPTFRMEEQFVVDVLQYGLGLDAVETSRPINHPATSRAGIYQNYDFVTYVKGACLVRMVAHLVGKDTFRKGIIRYLKTNAYGNAAQDDLWAALQAQVDEDGSSIIPLSVKEVMDTWTNKMGYPVVTVRRDYQTGRALIEQKRFLLSKSDIPSNDTTDYKWNILLTYTSNFLQKQNFTLLPVNLDNVTIPLSGGINSTHWVIFNVDQTGYYRVMYDDTNLSLLRHQLVMDNQAIPVINRAQIYDDYFNLAKAKITSYVDALSLTKALIHEKDYVPWAAASKALNYINMMLCNSLGSNEWKIYIREPVKKFYEHVGSESINDSHLLILARSLAYSWACGRLAMPDCVGKAINLYSDWMAEPSNSILVSPNLRWVISCTAVANGSWREWGFAYMKYNESTLEHEKIDFLLAMGCSTDPEIINHTLQLITASDSGIRIQDKNRIFNSIASSDNGHSIAMDFFAKRWDSINEYFKNYVGFGGNSYLSGFFKVLCTRVNTKEQLEKLRELVRDHPDQLKGVKSVKQGLDLAKSNIQWVADFSREIIDWIKRENEASSTVIKLPPTKTIKQKTGSSSVIAVDLALLVLLTLSSIIIHF